LAIKLVKFTGKIVLPIPIAKSEKEVKPFTVAVTVPLATVGKILVPFTAQAVVLLFRFITAYLPASTTVLVEPFRFRVILYVPPDGCAFGVTLYQPAFKAAVIGTPFNDVFGAVPVTAPLVWLTTILLTPSKAFVATVAD
jgi:hypothetical protein